MLNCRVMPQPFKMHNRGFFCRFLSTYPVVLKCRVCGLRTVVCKVIITDTTSQKLAQMGHHGRIGLAVAPRHYAASGNTTQSMAKLAARTQ
jgi:hypothetical protein